MAARAARRPDARAHPRPARHADHAGQGAGRPRARGCGASCAGSADAEYLGKLNGATGTYGAHVAAVPDADWPARQPVVRRGPRPDLEPADHADREPRLAGRAVCGRRAVQPGAAQPLHRRVDATSRSATSRRSAAQGTVGSSTMPHKVNPIRFENAEANLEVSNALLDVLAATLVQSPAAARPHRLLDAAQHRRRRSATRCSPSTTSRAGWPASTPCPRRMAADLDANWEVLGEADPVGDARARRRRACRAWTSPYERLKELTRGRRIGAEDMREFVAGLGLPADVEARLSAMTPADLRGRRARAGRLPGRRRRSLTGGPFAQGPSERHRRAGPGPARDRRRRSRGATARHTRSAGSRSSSTATPGRTRSTRTGSG